jgi:DNA-binding transcriptional regulator YiaG
MDCGGLRIKPEEHDLQFQYGVGADQVTLTATGVIEHVCQDCGGAFRDHTAELRQYDAVCRHLGLMTPAEVKKVRESVKMTRSEFAKASGIGEASLARWESGALMQNIAMNNFLYLLSYQVNLDRLAARSSKEPLKLIESSGARHASFPNLTGPEFESANSRKDKFTLRFVAA